MANLNEVKLIGRLTRDPAGKTTPTGLFICNLSLAIDDSYKDQTGNQVKEITFVDIDVFGKAAENCNAYLKKGQLVFVNGRLKFSTWDDKNTGSKRTKLTVNALSVQFLDKPGDKSAKDAGLEPSAPNPTTPNVSNVKLQSQPSVPTATFDSGQLPF